MLPFDYILNVYFYIIECSSQLSFNLQNFCTLNTLHNYNNKQWLVQFLIFSVFFVTNSRIILPICH